MDEPTDTQLPEPASHEGILQDDDMDEVTGGYRELLWGEAQSSHDI